VENGDNCQAYPRVGDVLPRNPDLRLIQFPGHSATVDRFWITYPQPAGVSKYFSGVYYILALYINTPHIWGYCFEEDAIFFRTNVPIVHRQGEFSTVLSQLSTVFSAVDINCLNKYHHIWALDMGYFG